MTPMTPPGHISGPVMIPRRATLFSDSAKQELRPATPSRRITRPERMPNIWEGQMRLGALTKEQKKLGMVEAPRPTSASGLGDAPKALGEVVLGNLADTQQ